MQFWKPQLQCASQSFLATSSTTSFEDAPFCNFCYSSNTSTTQCRSILPQLRATLINTHEANIPSVTGCLQWCPSNPYRRQCPLKYGSTMTSQHSMNPSSMYLPPQLWNPSQVIYGESVCDTTAFEQQDVKDQRTVTFPTSDCPPDAVVSKMTQSHSWSTPVGKGVVWHLLHQIPTIKLNRAKVGKSSSSHANSSLQWYKTSNRWRVTATKGYRNRLNCDRGQTLDTPHHSLHSLKREKRESYICKNTTYQTTKKALRFLNKTPLRHCRTQNTRNTR